MKLIETAGLRTLHCFDPERAHSLSIQALKMGLVPLGGVYTSEMLKTSVGGIELPNPLGLAAGFDKNATVVSPLSRSGFGFVEVGAATPRAQPGNPKPRLFRLTQDRGVINRFGFNNDGAEVIANRLAQTQTPVPRGLNLGANKDSENRAADYAQVLRIAGPHIDFATVNVSSPNTQNLRDLQGRAALEKLLAQVNEANQSLDKPIPIFLKIAPDLDLRDLQDIAEVALGAQLSGIIATNTTLDRSGLNDPQKDQAGGLSGAPLFEKSTRILAQLAQITDGKIDLIGVGGISNADQAYAKITAGASAIQLYSALVYQGFSLIHEVLKGLEDHLKRDGFTHISQAVGTKRDHWASPKN